MMNLHSVCFNEKSARRYKLIFNWLFETNPAQDGKTKSIVVESEGSIVGFLGVIPWKLKMNRNVRKATFSSGLMTDPLYRNHGVSISALKRWEENEDICLALGVGDIAKKRELDLGFREIDVVKYYVKIMHPFVRPKGVESIEVYETRKLDMVTEFCQKCMKEYGILTYRDSDYLKWRYFEHPENKYRFMVASDKWDIKGYIVITTADDLCERLRWGKIIDLFTKKSDAKAKQALLSAALSYFKQDNCHFVKTICSAKDYVNVLRKNRFFNKDLYPKNFLAYSKQTISLSASRWFINYGDSDIGI